MIDRPKSIIILILLWISLSGIFVLWGAYSLYYVLDIPTWFVDYEELSSLAPILHFGYLMSTIVWFVFSSLFILFAYGTYKGDHWTWSTGLIIVTIFLAIFGLMLASFMINALMFLDWFSVYGLVTVILSFLIDIGIMFFLTRPAIKIYFDEIRQKEKN